ncbi:Hypothetical protein FKW44_019414 [Caligus rogercresseyi]|uniref:Uncharacterized protein n=1 Tax=Caligus rogercresseyi TaxID=217165 RepID=A0A7T8JXD7_CALRO|nr:Hypothetical protein FKW44_019414 [Caligus rogercresseyi]
MSSELERRTVIMWRSVAAVRQGDHRLLQIPQSYCLQHCQVLQGVGGHRGRILTRKERLQTIPSRKRSTDFIDRLQTMINDDPSVLCRHCLKG